MARRREASPELREKEKEADRKYKEENKILIREKSLAYYYEHKDEIGLRRRGNRAEEIRKFRKAYPEKSKHYNDISMARLRAKGYFRNYRFGTKYGVTAEDWEDIYNPQGRVCAICKQEKKNMHLDHDHKTGEVRGILCNTCNMGIGCLKDSTEILQAAISYLEGC